MIPLIGPILSAVGNVAVKVITAKAEKEQAKINLKARQVQVAADQITQKIAAEQQVTKNDFELANNAINDWSKSFKDEIVLITIIMPLFSYFLFGLTGWVNLKEAGDAMIAAFSGDTYYCLLYTSPSPRD